MKKDSLRKAKKRKLAFRTPSSFIYQKQYSLYGNKRMGKTKTKG